MTDHYEIISDLLNAKLPLPSGRRTLKFPFAFDTAGLLTGHQIYVPTVGDILHDAWFEIDTAWDGTTPKGDLGTFAGGAGGWWGNNNVPLDFTRADIAFGIYDALLLDQQAGGNTGQISSLLSMNYLQSFSSGAPHITDGWVRAVPAKFVTVDPIKVVVSQNGTPTGADPGSTVGAAVLYLDISTPQ